MAPKQSKAELLDRLQFGRGIVSYEPQLRQKRLRFSDPLSSDLLPVPFGSIEMPLGGNVPPSFKPVPSSTIIPDLPIGVEGVVTWVGESNNPEEISLWHPTFNHTSHIDQHLRFPVDDENFKKIGNCGLSQSLRMAAMTRAVEENYKHGEIQYTLLKNERELLAQKVVDLQDSEARIKALEDELASLKVNHNKLVEEKAKSDNEVVKLQAENNEVIFMYDSALTEWANEETYFLNQINEYCQEGALQYVEGFNNALSQAWVIAPNADFSPINISNEVVDGEIVPIRRGDQVGSGERLNDESSRAADADVQGNVPYGLVYPF